MSLQRHYTVRGAVLLVRTVSQWTRRYLAPGVGRRSSSRSGGYYASRGAVIYIVEISSRNSRHNGGEYKEAEDEQKE